MNISKIKVYKDVEKYCLYIAKTHSDTIRPCVPEICEIHKLCADYNSAKITKEQFLEMINIQARKEKLKKLLS